MDKAGDWIYIILLLIVGISSLFSSSKEKKKKKRSIQQPSFPENTSKEKTSYPFDPQQTEKKQTLRQSLKSETKTIPTYSPINSDNIQPEESATPPCAKDDHLEELRKAIIYTEILNRKY